MQCFILLWFEFKKVFEPKNDLSHDIVGNLDQKRLFVQYSLHISRTASSTKRLKLQSKQKLETVA